MVLLISLLIFTEASDVIITNDDINCHVNYDQNLNCDNQKIVYDGSEKQIDNSFWLMISLPLGLVGFWIGRRIL